MAYLVTGASGFIGSRLCLSLAEQGKPVVAFCRRPPKPDSGLNQAGIEIAVGDVRDRDTLAAAMRKCTSCFHLAAVARQWSRNQDEYDRVNVNGTLNVLEAAVKHGISRLVFTSTAGIFGASGAETITELWEPSARLRTRYERTKLEAERKVLDYARKGLHAVVVNPTRAFGPGPLTEANSLTRIMIKFVRGKWRFLPGDGHHVGNYVFVDDVVRGHQLALEHGQPGRRYLLGGEDLSFQELFGLLQPYARRQQQLIHVPEKVVMLFAYGCLGLANCLPVDPQLTPEFASRYFADSRVSSERARRELGYEPGSVRDGIRKTMEWIDRNGISLGSPPSHRKRHAAD